MAMKLIRGDRVRVRKGGTNDDWTNATVAVVSPNGQAAGLLLHGFVRAGRGLVGGALPLNIDIDTGICVSLMGDTYDIQILGLPHV